MPVSKSDELIPVALARLARERADSPAYTFVDYDVDPDGFFETLTWSEVYRRARVVAAELARHGGPGDRVAILAPQSMDYIIGFLGALQAGLVAVPLSVPAVGAHDERAAGVLADCEPAAVLTSTTTIDAVLPVVNAVPGLRVAVIELDALDYDHDPGELEVDHVGARPALLQYTSGSTGTPSGVVVTHANVVCNIGQITADQFVDVGGYPPPDTTLVSWLPFFHDLGLMLGILAPVGTGLHAVVTSPISFLQKPSRWMRLLAGYPRAHSAAPNFAFELAARRTRDEDLDGMSLESVHAIMNAAERVQSGTVRRFNERFAQFGLSENAQMPAYGLAEATLYVASLEPGTTVPIVRFDYERLAAGVAERTDDETGSEQVGLGRSRSTRFVIVDPKTFRVCQDGNVGEVWVHGGNVAAGYWRDAARTDEVFGAQLDDPAHDIPTGPWMRTGDLGVISEGELFLVGRIKDLIIVDGRNHYPDDIEATVSAHTGARTAAISVSGQDTEQLVVIAELRRLPDDPDVIATLVSDTRTKVANAVARAHNLRVADVVLVAQGAIPITTSGKTRRRESAELHRSGAFERLGQGA